MIIERRMECGVGLWADCGWMELEVVVWRSDDGQTTRERFLARRSIEMAGKDLKLNLKFAPTVLQRNPWEKI